MVENQIFVGKQKPRPSLVNPIQNRESAPKPKGGIWTSPMRDSGYSAFEAYEGGSLVRNGTDAWLLIPDGSENVIEIDTVEDLEQLPAVEEERLHKNRTYIDFEAVFASGCDGLKVSSDVAHIKSFAADYNLSGWDFESIIWSNLSWIDEVEYLGSGKERREEAEF